MDLRSPDLLWPRLYRGPILGAVPLTGAVQCDVAVIGAGISGAFAAYYLAKAGFSVVVVDRREPASGSTAASTGLLLYELDVHLTDLRRLVSPDRATEAYHASAAALGDFPPLVDELGDTCGLIQRPSLYLASSEDDARALKEECEARRSIGITVDFLPAGALADSYGLRRPAALCSPQAYEVDPYRLTLRLLERSIALGTRLFAGTAIATCSPAESGVILTADFGATIHAHDVVLATGYEAMLQLPSDLFTVTSTFVVASPPLAWRWPERCLVWETARPYLYVRSTPDDRALVGGEDVPITNPQARDALLDAKTSRLCRRFASLFGHEIQPAHAWAGAFAHTPDGLPYIGTMRHLPHCHFALGYGGNGITFSLLAAQIIRDALLGRPSRWATTFAFER